MGSNDDVQFVTSQPNLIQDHTIDGSVDIQIYTVPAGKRWILRSVSVSTGSSNDLSINVRENASAWVAVIAVNRSATELVFVAPCDIRLSSGWQVVVGMGTASSMVSTILYEEETEY